MVEITLNPIAVRSGGKDAKAAPRLQRRVCLLTGAAGKLGTAFIERYGETCDIVAVYHKTELSVPSQDTDLVDPLAPNAQLAENRRSVFAVRADLANDADLSRAVELTLARYDRIDLLINAGADTRFHGSLMDIGVLDADFSRQMAINVTAPLKLAALVGKQFWSRNTADNLKNGRNIVNVSSISSLRVFPHVGQAMYGASKAALNYLTAHLTAELRPYGVRANALAPTRFPDRITTLSVVEAIGRIDRSDMNGKIVVLDEQGARVMGERQSL